MRSYILMQSESKTLPDEDGGVRSRCEPLFGQVWRTPVLLGSGRSGPSTGMAPFHADHEQCYSHHWAGEKSCCRTIGLPLSPESRHQHINNHGKDRAVRHLGAIQGSLRLRNSTQRWTFALSCCLHPHSVSICLHFLAFHVLYTQQQSFC